MNIPKTTTFSFEEIETDSVKKMTASLDTGKSGTFGGIQVNCLKDVWDILAKFLHSFWNDEVFKNSKFSGELRLTDAVPAFKKENSTLVENYRPISLLLIISNIFERTMVNQITTYMNEYLSHLWIQEKFNTKIAFFSYWDMVEDHRQ